MLSKNPFIPSPSSTNSLVKAPWYTTEWVLDVEYKIAASSSCSWYFWTTMVNFHLAGWWYSKSVDSYLFLWVGVDIILAVISSTVFGRIVPLNDVPLSTCFFLERWDMDVTFLILCTIGEYEALGRITFVGGRDRVVRGWSRFWNLWEWPW